MAEKKLKIKQIGSPIKRLKTQGATLKGLGLRKMHHVVELQDTPEIRGMLKKVQHLVEVL